MSRIHCLNAFIFALIQAKTVNLALLASLLVGTHEAAYKRLQRFIKQIAFPADRLAYFIVAIIGLKKSDSWQLIFDRTNWKFGKKHINILYLAVSRNRIAIPLFFKFLKDKKLGNSSQEDRIELMNRFIKTFGKPCIGLILGDREFFGHQWFTFLIKEKLPFCFRLKESWHKVSLADGRSVPVKQCFKGLKTGESRTLGKRQWSEGPTAVDCYISGMRNLQGEWIVVAHSQNMQDPCGLYRNRWQIETMFKAMKTSGFNIEDTHVTNADRLECLFAIVAIAYAICYQMGQIVVKDQKEVIKKHGYYAKSIFRQGLDKISQAIARLHDKPRLFKRLLSQIFQYVRLTKKNFVL